jgi:hypothetical protein
MLLGGFATPEKHNCATCASRVDACCRRSAGVHPGARTLIWFGARQVPPVWRLPKKKRTDHSRRITMKRILATAALTALLAACGSDNDNSGPAKLSLSVTDAPVDSAEAVVVSFSGLELLPGDGGEAVSFEFDPPLSIDLLQLQGDNSAFLIQDADIEPGVYDELRLIIDTENASCNNLAAPFESYITIDGTDYPLVVPSGGSSGLKVFGPITAAAGGSAAYTIDFDLRASIAERGVTGCYNLRPVLRVVDNAEVGTLVGSVDPALLTDSTCTADPVTGAGAAVYIYEGAGVVPDDADGIDPEPLTSALLTPVEGGAFTYEVGFLLAGDYTAAVTCQAGDDEVATDDEISFAAVADVAISADTVTEQDFAVVSAP